MDLPTIDHLVSIIGGLTALVVTVVPLTDRWPRRRRDNNTLGRARGGAAECP